MAKYRILIEIYDDMMIKEIRFRYQVTLKLKNTIILCRQQGGSVHEIF